MSKKCKDVNMASNAFAQSIKEREQRSEQIEKEHSGYERQSEQGRKFGQSLKDMIKTKTKKVYEKGPSKIIDLFSNLRSEVKEKDVLDKLKKYYPNRNKREQIGIALQLRSLMQKDPHTEWLVNSMAEDYVINVADHDALRSIGEPIIIDPITKTPDITTMPLYALRDIYSYVIDSYALEPGDLVIGTLGTNLRYEFSLPKNLARKVRSMPLVKSVKTLENSRNKEQALTNSFMKPSPHMREEEKEMTDAITGVEWVSNLKRHQAGMEQFTDWYANFYNTSFEGGVSPISSQKEMFRIVDGLRRGQIFFRIDNVKDTGFYEVYQYRSRKHPVLDKKGGFKKYDNGDIVFEWTGVPYTEEQQLKFQEQDIDPVHNWYVEPYMTEKGEPLRLKRRDAEELDAAIQMQDNIYAEIANTMIDSWDVIKERYQAILDKYDYNELKDVEILSNLKGRMEEWERAVDHVEHAKVQDFLQETRAKKKKTIGRILNLENGESIEVRNYERYSTDMYHMSEMPKIMREVIDGLDNTIEELRGGKLDPIQNPDADDRRSSRLQLNDLILARAGIQEAYTNFMESDWIHNPNEEMSVWKLPFEKYFKQISNFIPAEYRRTDSEVTALYVRSMAHNLILAQNQIDILENYLEEDVPAIKEYIHNIYRQSVNSLDAEGSLLGIRFSDRQLATALGVDPMAMRQFAVQWKRFLAGVNLSNITQGAQQLPSHLTKIYNVGFDTWQEAFVESQKPENYELMYQRGVFSFDDVMESILLTHSDETDAQVHQKVLKDLKEEIRVIRENKVGKERDQALYTLQKELKKVKQTPQVKFIQKFSTWAITGRVDTYDSDSQLTGYLKWAGRIMNPYALSKSEKSLRGASYMIGVMKAIDSGMAVNKKDPKAHEMGLRFMNHTDMFLGTEGVGDQFGNDILKLLNSVSIWRTQKFAKERHSLKHMWASFKPTEFSGLSPSQRNAVALWNFFKYSVQGMAVLAMPIGGAALGYSAITPILSSGTMVNGLASMASILGGAYGGRKLQESTPFISPTDKSTFRKGNPLGSRGINEFMTHLGMAVFSHTVLFSNMASGALAGYAGIAAALDWTRKNAYTSGGSKFMTSLNGPMWGGIVGMALLISKALDDEDEVEVEDVMKIIGLMTGIGGNAVVLGLLAAFDVANNSKLPVKYRSRKDSNFENFVEILQPEVLEQFPFWDTNELVKDGKDMMVNLRKYAKRKTIGPERVKFFTPK